jgi:hypothetical protein
MIRNRKWLGFLFVLGCILCRLPFAFGSDQFCTTPEAVFSGADAAPWERVELLKDNHPGFVQEAFSPQGQQLNPQICKWFAGNPAPHSKYFLLHCGKGFLGKTFANPVLLVHGAGDNANRGWIHPKDAVMPKEFPFDRQGFAVHLANQGYSVFAVTFAHNQGCNIMQSEQIANAIRRIRALLKKEGDPQFKVDVVAHSKGNVAVRLYCSDGRAIFPKKTFLSKFRGDVRKYIAIAAPMRGIDTSYRYYAYNLTLAEKGNLNAPFGCDKILHYGIWKTTAGTNTKFHDAQKFFPGQCQLLFNLVRDGDLPLGAESMTPFDMNYTAGALYRGGVSLVISSKGIDSAIEEGERLIYRLEEKGIDPRIHLGVIAGSSPFLSCHIPGYGYFPMPHEILSAPMDGVVFLKSATHLDGILKRGAVLLGKEILNLNHLGVCSRPEAFKVVDRLLQKAVSTH